jgi:homoserine O-acetyltransferase
LKSYTSTYSLPVDIPGLKTYHHRSPFLLEAGGEIPELSIAYHTYGQLNERGDNVVWACHALTANSDVVDWWPGLFGPDTLFDPKDYFIVCANVLGSCYGTTGPRSINPQTGEAYGLDFPAVTIRDWVRAHDLLRQHLGIETIHLLMGGSCGGHQVMEWAYLLGDRVKQLAMLVTSAKESAWAIAFHEAGRLALLADTTFQQNTDKAGSAGLKAARGLGLMAYRTIDAYIATQSDSKEKLDDFKAASYIRYQGHKLERRFYAHSYYNLLKALDTHDIGRGRGGIKNALADINQRSIIIGIETDLLIPPQLQRILAGHMPNATYCEIGSKYGHDGFLIEVGEISRAIGNWLVTEN